jgi:site-specific recombinase XerD
MVLADEPSNSHLRVALAQSLETDDQIILGHVREALQILGEKEKFMITVAELYEALERDYIINCRKSRRNITSVLENHLRAAFGQLPAAGVSSDKIAEYIVARQKQGAKNATINRETSCLQRLYTLAVQAGKLTRSPHIFHQAERNVRQVFLRDSQVDALARETARIGVWLHGIFLVAFTYGWRKTELLRLRVRQCDFIERSITLDAGTTKCENTGRFRSSGSVRLRRQEGARPALLKS